MSLSLLQDAPPAQAELFTLWPAWDFWLTRSYQVTALDFCNHGTPYSDAHPVCLGAASLHIGYPVGTGLAMVTFGPGVPGTTNGLFHSFPFVLAPALIQAGVLLQPNSDPYLFSQTSYTLLPGITFKGGHVDATGVFTCPDGSNFVSGNFAANLEAQPVSASASEPPSLLLTSFGCLIGA